VAVDVSTDIVIRRPRDRVAAYAADPDRAPDWYVNIKSAEWTTPKPLGIGSRVTFVAEFLGRRLRYTYEVVDYVPGRKLVMSTAEGPFPMETTYLWEETEKSATRMTLRNRGEPVGFSKALGPLMAFAIRRANRKDLRRLKLILEHESG
jgi:uncharacterized protein YndB with AHSA1/START domain